MRTYKRKQYKPRKRVYKRKAAKRKTAYKTRKAYGVARKYKNKYNYSNRSNFIHTMALNKCRNSLKMAQAQLDALRMQSENLPVYESNDLAEAKEYGVRNLAEDW